MERTPTRRLVTRGGLAAAAFLLVACVQPALAEVDAMQPRHSQHQPGQEIPEDHWAYRFAKKHWFFGFGAYT